MKRNKIFSIIFSILFIIYQILTSSASALAASDLHGANVEYFRAEIADRDGALDGILSSGEYTLCNHVFLSERDNTFKIMHSSDIDTKSSIAVYLDYDADFLRVGIKFDENIILSPVLLDNGASAYSIMVQIGLNSTFPEYFSYLENQYLFSTSDFSCIGVSGARAVYSGTNKKFIGTISSITPEPERPYTDSYGTLWNGNRYAEEACLTADPGFVFECRIPMGDLLQIASSSLLDENGCISSGTCGGFSFSTNMKKSDSFTIDAVFCGISSSDLCPLSSTGATWQDYFSGQTGLKKAMIPDWCMLPLYFSAIPQNTQQSAPSTEGDVSQDSGGEVGEIPSVSVPVSTTTGADLFPGLPQIGDEIDLNSEVVYEEENIDKNEDSISSVLLLVAGFFLFMSVIGTAFLFRYLEQKEKNRKEKKKTNKK